MSNFFSNSIASKFGNAIGNIGQNLNSHEIIMGKHALIHKEKISEGGFGIIELVYDNFTKTDYVLKRCNIDLKESYEVINKEIQLLQKFKSPFIVQYIDSIIIEKDRKKEALILLEFCPGGHLLERLNKRNGQKLPTDVIFKIFGQILSAVKILHQNLPPITHRDLKLENILFGMDGNVRLCDFGSCVEGPVYMRNPQERQLAEEIILKETTQIYRSPEMIDLYLRSVLTEKCDIWALGCILYSLVYLSHPFQNLGGLGILNSKVIFPSVSDFSDIEKFILLMLDFDPEARPDIQTLIEFNTQLSQGNSLPEYLLSEEANTRRKERLEAEKNRQPKTRNRRNNAQKLHPSKNALPLSSNSVAAKRLAAKRGQAIPLSDDSSALSNSFKLDDKISKIEPVVDTTNFDAKFDANFDSLETENKASQALDRHFETQMIQNHGFSFDPFNENQMSHNDTNFAEFSVVDHEFQKKKSFDGEDISPQEFEDFPQADLTKEGFSAFDEEEGADANFDQTFENHEKNTFDPFATTETTFAEPNDVKPIDHEIEFDPFKENHDFPLEPNNSNVPDQNRYQEFDPFDQPENDSNNFPSNFTKNTGFDVSQKESPFTLVSDNQIPLTNFGERSDLLEFSSEFSFQTKNEISSSKDTFEHSSSNFNSSKAIDNSEKQNTIDDLLSCDDLTGMASKNNPDLDFKRKSINSDDLLRLYDNPIKEDIIPPPSMIQPTISHQTSNFHGYDPRFNNVPDPYMQFPHQNQMSAFGPYHPLHLGDNLRATGLQSNFDTQRIPAKFSDQSNPSAISRNGPSTSSNFNFQKSIDPFDNLKIL